MKKIKKAFPFPKSNVIIEVSEIEPPDDEEEDIVAYKVEIKRNNLTLWSDEFYLSQDEDEIPQLEIQEGELSGWAANEGSGFDSNKPEIRIYGIESCTHLQELPDGKWLEMIED